MRLSRRRAIIRAEGAFFKKKKMGMRKIFLACVAVMVGVTAMADERSEAMLKRVAEYVKALGAYEAEFAVGAGDYSTTGRYVVDGDAYHIVVDRAEVYSDGRVRYEVDHERREINVDEMDLKSRNIMDNPTRCFDFVGTEYRSEWVSEDGRSVTLHLRSADQTVEGDIYLTVRQASGQPEKIVYHLYDDSIEVDVKKIESRKGGVKSFREADFRGYDIVDFR